jgi:hypothetical protein
MLFLIQIVLKASSEYKDSPQRHVGLENRNNLYPNPSLLANQQWGLHSGTDQRWKKEQ